MTRRRWRITVLAALATYAAVFPITSLFMVSDWLTPAAVVIALTAGVGLLLRGLTSRRLLVPLVQLVVVAYVVLFRFAGDSFRWLLPTGATVDVLTALGEQASQTITRYTAPAPVNEGVTFVLVAATALVAIAVDAAAATWRSPAAAGLPLLTAYLITAANGQSALALRYFVLPVAIWLVMVHTSARAQFGRWSTTSTTDSEGVDDLTHDRAAMRSFSAAAARVGAVGVVTALALAAVVPHMAPRYLTEGLGRVAGADGEGTVGFNDTLDLANSLNNTDQSPVLTYTTTAFTRPPLRVVTTSYYSRGQWLQAGGNGSGLSQPQPLPSVSLRRDYTLTVTDNTLKAPRIAVPYPVVSVAMEGTPWGIDPVTRDVRVGQAVSSYLVTYADLAPTVAQLRDAGAPDSPDITEDDLVIPDVARGLIQRWSDQVTAGADNSLDKAVKIQDHLRNTGNYTYSLDLGAPLRDEAGRIVEPIRTFYETKRGYCVQFATAMIMLARAQGIPARMAIGFLPGQSNGEKFVVKASDAHAWPELYFQGYGWLRFEPTPGARSGTPPPYAVQGDSPAPTGGGRDIDESETTSGGASASATTSTAVAGGGSGDESLLDRLAGAFTVRNVLVFVGILLAVGSTFTMPLTAWAVRTRRRRAAATRQELIEAEWADLTSHLGDLGLDGPPGGTLRQERERYIREGHLGAESAQALGRVTATLERARYARPERTSLEQAQELAHDIRTIRRDVGRQRSWTTRLRGFLWPQAGVDVWRRARRRRR